MRAPRKDIRTIFADPPREFGAMPFWFWNDDLTEEELLRQVREFHARGFGGFIPHARIGLSRRVGYLTEEYFRLLRLVVEEAARLGMKVVLYDEGSYPSGSAQGRVAAENPAYAARCLIPLYRKVAGPAKGYWRPNPGRALQDRLLCVIQGREVKEGVLDPETLTLLEPTERGLVRLDVPRGDWRLVACWDVPSGGSIRGVFEEEEDQSAMAPPAGDIMNPDAVACFLRHTHEQFYSRLRDHFGKTIIGMFTDEPSPMGRGPRRGPHPRPFTEGFLDDVQAQWDGDVRRWLPALWLDCGRRTEEFRRTYDRAVEGRVESVFYAAQSRWCGEHGIALTGHPHGSNQMRALRQFHWPGQDMVWRWVTPGSPSALEGDNSVAPKCAASAATLRDCRRNASEALGAYGWGLTLDEAKWLLDWHLVRGNNLFFLHACFYSICGRRAYESEPDLGVHNVWWPHFGVLADYLRRVCWLLTDGAPVCRVAIWTDPDNVAWRAAKRLLQGQMDFIYVDEKALLDARIEGGALAIGRLRLKAVVCDPPAPGNPMAIERLKLFQSQGGLVIEDGCAEDVPQRLVPVCGRDVDWPGAPDLRALHYRKEDMDFHLLVNEGEDAIEGGLSLAGEGGLELWDPLDGSARPWPARRAGGRLHTYLRLERRQGLVLAVDSKGTADPALPLPAVPDEVLAEVPGPWKALDGAGRAVEVPCPGDWAQIHEWETFSGTLRFLTEFRLPADAIGRAAFLDLGRVGEIAEVVLNGVPIGARAWAPHVLSLGDVRLSSVNSLEVRVTNSMANAYEGAQRLSGLMGPVAVRTGRAPSLPQGR